MLTVREMPYHTGLVVKIYPSREQKRLIAVNDGAKRAVYNHLVACSNEIYQLRKTASFVPRDRERIAYLKSVSGNVSGIKNAKPFLYGTDVDEQAIANAILNYKRAWKNMKELHRGVPTWKRKNYAQSYQTNAHYYKNGSSNVRFEDKHHVTLPKLKRIRFDGSPRYIDKLLSSTNIRIGAICISRDAVGEYWASFSLASTSPFHDKLEKTGSETGIDLNLLDLVDTSSGDVVENKRFLVSAEKKLAKQQHKLSRKYEAAKRNNREFRDIRKYQQQRRKVAYLHRKVARQREDYLHEVSKQLIENQDLIVAEDLKVRNLVKNHRLARAISDAGWRTLLTMLQYKGREYGKTVILVPPQFTSQTCSVCGYVLKENERLSLSDRIWNCPQCHTHHHRDINAAEVILQKGLASLH